MSLTFTYTGTDFPPDLQAPGRRRRQPLRPTVLGREAPVGPRSRRAGFLAKLVSHCFSIPGNGSERPRLPITDVCLKRVLNVAWTVSTGGESRAFGFSESERRVRGLRWLEACGRVGQDAACTADSQTLPPAALPTPHSPRHAARREPRPPRHLSRGGGSTLRPGRAAGGAGPGGSAWPVCAAPWPVNQLPPAPLRACVASTKTPRGRHRRRPGSAKGGFTEWWVGVPRNQGGL